MARKPPTKTTLELSTTTEDPLFALSSDALFASLVAPLGTLPDIEFDYAYVATNASTPGVIRIDDDLEGLNGIIATGNGKDDVDISNSTGNNVVIVGNGNDKVVGGEGEDIVLGGNGTDNLMGGAGNDRLSGGNAKDILAGGTDNGAAVVTFSATDANGDPLEIFTNNPPALAEGAVLTGTEPATGNSLVEEGVFIDIATSPDTISHIFSFAPTDVGGDGGTADFVIGVYDADGTLVDAFNVTMTEGVANSFSLIDNDTPDDGGTVAVFAAATVAPDTLEAATPLALATEDYTSVTLTPESVEITAGDELYGGLANDVFVYAEGDGVDVIYDYKRGDVIQLVGIDLDDVTTFVDGGDTFLLFSDGAGDFAVDSAIQLVDFTGRVQFDVLLS